MNSPVQAEEGENTVESEGATHPGDCELSCLIQQRKADVVCGQKAEECFEKTGWYPWWISGSARATCQTSLETCEIVANTDKRMCSVSCSEERTRELKERTRELEILREKLRLLDQKIEKLEELKFLDETA